MVYEVLEFLGQASLNGFAAPSLGMHEL